MTATTHSYGYIRDGKVYRKGFLDFPDKEIGEVKTDEENAIRYFEDRFHMARQKVETLENEIEEAENKGSYLMKLIHLRRYLSEFDALGDFEELFAKLDTQEAVLREIIAENRVKNLQIKQALLEEGDQIQQNPDWKEATEQIKDLKMRWIKTGSVAEEHQEEIEGAFQDLVNKFFDKKKAYYEDKKRMMDMRIEKYNDLISRAEQLMRLSDPATAFDKSKQLQREWKRLEKIPPQLHKSLTFKFRGINDRIFRRFKSGQRNIRSRSKEDNLKVKQDLLEKARSLKNEDSQQAVEQVRQLQTDWKNAGSIPPEHFRSMTEEFNLLCDMVRERNFLGKLTHSKAREAGSDNPKDVVKLKIKILKDLLQRDEKELEAFQQNIQNLNSDANNFNRMLDGKLSLQQRKVKVKKQLMSELRQTLLSMD